MKKTPLWRLGLSCFGSHIGAIVLCSVLVFSLLTLWENKIYQVCITLFCLFLYWAIVSSVGWHAGNKDLNKIHFKHMEYDPWRGTKIGLMASIPIFALDLLLLLSHFINMGVITTYGMVAFRLINPHVMVFINMIVGEGSKTVAEVPFLSLLLSCLLTLSLLISVITGYILGYKDVVLMDKLVYKKKK